MPEGQFREFSASFYSCLNRLRPPDFATSATEKKVCGKADPVDIPVAHALATSRASAHARLWRIRYEFSACSYNDISGLFVTLGTAPCHAFLHASQTTPEGPNVDDMRRAKAGGGYGLRWENEA